ncbi:B-box zinc finger protein 21-like isoform X1 [Rhododendron vialii]|uniref:B-box zinc finger protein 21-like isoform X1 n=1 Tax=Rhododendron vialii TaxID=182163 RepID=UPI00265D632E|nr:B-box zinc finger protein 21-like isoform X1 [Rhododendron vialii]
MKIQCDVCSKEEASVFCSADEATLCVGCDRRVHHANKLASKHMRFSLQLPSSSSDESPRCDVCQEKRAILFCQEDRAMLCTECDIPIHKANELTEKHNRFLLTGARLSASSSSSSNVGDFATDSPIFKSSVSNRQSKPSSYRKGPSSSTSSHCRADMDCCPSQENSASLSNTSSISEYLMETLPGWRVDDFLDPSCSHPGLCKVCSKLGTLITRTQTAHIRMHHGK